MNPPTSHEQVPEQTPGRAQNAAPGVEERRAVVVCGHHVERRARPPMLGDAARGDVRRGEAEPLGAHLLWGPLEAGPPATRMSSRRATRLYIKGGPP